MRLKVEAFFKVETWDKRFLLKDLKMDWTKATITDQGLDRMGDSYWIGGIHLGSGGKNYEEASTGIQSPLQYLSRFSKDTPSVDKVGEDIVWKREMEVRLSDPAMVGQVINELALSWDEDSNTATAILGFSGTSYTADQELIVTCVVTVTESMSDTTSGIIDFGASKHSYVIRPCYYEKYVDALIGTALAQPEGKIYSGGIPDDVRLEPKDAIDTNLAIFETYTFKTRSKVFHNFFTLSSPNAYTRVVTSHTYGLPSAFGVEFDPPIDKDFNRELTLDFKINWDRR